MTSDSGAPALWQHFDAVGFDLDGVIYRGPQAVPVAPGVIEALRQGGCVVGFVTNNAQRSPAEVGGQLARLGIPNRPADIVTSAQATARLMADELPAGAAVLCAGTPALAAEIAAVGLRPLPPSSRPVAAVCVGFDPAMTWADLNAAAYAVQAGAAFYACNDDATRPTEQGTAIGMGGILAALAKALPGVAPRLGGKPARPLLDETRRRLGASRPLFAGDRLDTDVAGAHNAGWESLFVLTGTHGPADLVAAAPQLRPGYLAADIAGLLEPPRQATANGTGWRCGEALAQLSGDHQVTVDGPLSSPKQRLDALWAVAQLAWQQADRAKPVDAGAALARIGSFSSGQA